MNGSASPVRINLGEDFVHDASGKDDLPIGNRRRSVRLDTVMKTFNQFLHSEVLVKPLPNKIGDVNARVPKMLAGSPQRRYEIS